MTTTYLYRAKDEAGVVLYVGITGNPERRQATHACNAPWRELSMDSLDWVEFDNREDAAAFEKAEIARLRPKFNKALNPDLYNMTEGEKKQISFSVDKQLHTAWKVLAIDKEVTLQKLIMDAMAEYQKKLQ